MNAEKAAQLIGGLLPDGARRTLLIEKITQELHDAGSLNDALRCDGKNHRYKEGATFEIKNLQCGCGKYLTHPDVVRKEVEALRNEVEMLNRYQMPTEVMGLPVSEVVEVAYEIRTGLVIKGHEVDSIIKKIASLRSTLDKRDEVLKVARKALIESLIVVEKGLQHEPIWPKPASTRITVKSALNQLNSVLGEGK